MMKDMSALYKINQMFEDTNVGAEVVQGKPFHCIDTELRAWLHNGEPSGHCRYHSR